MAGPTRLVIVGGVAGGASAAAKARRISEDAQIIMFERGKDVSFANCGLAYHIAGTIRSRDRLLVHTPESLKDWFSIDVRTNSQVTRIDPRAKTVQVLDLSTGRQYEQPYDVLILSPGAGPVRPPIPGIGHDLVFTLRTLEDMDAIKKVVDSGRARSAVVIGAGYIGLEMAEALVVRGIRVSLVEMDRQVMAPLDPEMASPIHEHLRSKGVDLQLQTKVSAIQPAAEGLEVRLDNGRQIGCDLVIVATGVRPEVELARQAGLRIGPKGGIVVDQMLRTSDPFIFAIGDAIEVREYISGISTCIPLAGPANRQGRIAAINAFGGNVRYRGTQGTAICKVFDMTVAVTGLNEKTLAGMDIPYQKVYLHPFSHATYYPGATQMGLKIIFRTDNGKILGAQCVGHDGVDKRIDVLAVAIRAGMSVYDLEELELAYAPPYGSAKDPVNYAGFVAANVLKGQVKVCHSHELIGSQGDRFLLDVRTPTEFARGTIPGAVNIPLQQLRSRLSELPRDRQIVVFCQVGMRGYLACRILAQMGFDCCNLSGGYKTYLHTVSVMGKT